MRSAFTLFIYLTIIATNCIQTVEAEQLTNGEIRDAIESGRLQPLGAVISIIELECALVKGSEVIEVKVDDTDWVYRITLLTRSRHILQIEVDGTSGRIEGFHQFRRDKPGDADAHPCG